MTLSQLHVIFQDNAPTKRSAFYRCVSIVKSAARSCSNRVGGVSNLVGQFCSRQKENFFSILGVFSLAHRNAIFTKSFFHPPHFSSTLRKGGLCCAYTLSTERQNAKNGLSGEFGAISNVCRPNS